MKSSFLDIIRTPDDIKIQTESSPLRFEEKGAINDTRAEIKCTTKNGILKIYLYSNGDAVKRIQVS